MTPLQILLKVACDAMPRLRRSDFTVEAESAFTYLREGRYLTENERLANSVRVLGVGELDVKSSGANRYYYEMCGGAPVELPMEQLRIYDVDFEPLAILLGDTYRCGARPTELVRNSLWRLGVPEKGGAEVYLARNIGTDAEVRGWVAALGKGVAVLWFGACPGMHDTDAALYRLSDFLRWEDGIVHKEGWPAILLPFWSYCPHENAMILLGDIWFIWFDGKGPVTISSSCRGMLYIVRLIEANGESRGPWEVMPPKEVPEAPNLDREDWQSIDGTEDVLLEYDQKELAVLWKDYTATRAKLAKARENGDEKTAAELAKIVEMFDEHMKKATRPGGKSAVAVDPYGDTKRCIRSAIDVVCKRLGDRMHNRRDIADHLHRYIKLGDDNRYLDRSRTWFIVTHE